MHALGPAWVPGPFRAMASTNSPLGGHRGHTDRSAQALGYVALLKERGRQSTCTRKTTRVPRHHLRGVALVIDFSRWPGRGQQWKGTHARQCSSPRPSAVDKTSCLCSSASLLAADVKRLIALLSLRLESPSPQAVSWSGALARNSDPRVLPDLECR